MRGDVVLQAGRLERARRAPAVFPTVLNGVKAVVVDNKLKSIEPLAYHFVVDFAKDNDLQVIEACILPEPSPPL